MQGNPYRITRDDVNAAGGTATGGGFLLSGSVGGIDTQYASLPSSFILQPGLQGIYFYPDTVNDVDVSTAANDRIDIEWKAPRGKVPAADLGVPGNYPPASSYVVKYSSVTSIDTQAAFEAANTAAQSLAPLNPDQDEFLAIPGLLSNTSYFISVESLDDETARGKNASYFSNAFSTYTQCNIPVLLDVTNWSVGKTSLRPRWNTMNQDARDPIVFDVEMVDNFTGITTVAQTPPDNSIGTSNLQFTSLQQGRLYSFRVRARNLVNVPTLWSVQVSTEIPVGLPEPAPFTEQDVSSVRANWIPDGGLAALPADWPVTGPIFEAQFSNNGGFDEVSAGNFVLRTTPLQARTTSYLFVDGQITPNTTYYAQVRAWPEGPGNPTLWVDMDWTMSGVHRSNSGNYTAHVDSASFNWSAAAGNPNRFFYRVEMSTDAAFNGTIHSTVVDNTQTAANVTGLTPNTLYHARLVTLNGIMIPAALGPLPLTGSPAATRPVDPVAGVFTGVWESSMSFNWASGGNSNQTIYRVQASSDPSGAFGWISAENTTTAGALSHLFNVPLELLANTTYFARVRADGQSGSPSNYVNIVGSTVTRPTSAASSSFTAMATTGFRVNWSNVNGTAQNGADTRYRVDLRLTPAGAVVQTQTQTGLSSLFGSLAINTTHYVTITSLSRGPTWPDAASISAATATLADVPTAGAPIFSPPTDNSVTYSWGPNGNPSDTNYLVQATTQVGGDFTLGISSSVFKTAPAALNHAFTGLLANTSYWFRVAGSNRNDVLSAYRTESSPAVTLARPVSIASLEPHVSSITLHVDNNGNGANTTYEVRRDGGPILSYLSTAGTESLLVDVGLSTNSSHGYEVRSIARNGIAGPWSTPVQSTWTLCAPDARVNVGANQPTWLDITLSPGSNPTAAPQTQFAIQLYLVDPDGFPVLSRHYLGPPAGMNGGRQIHLPMASPDVPHWMNFSEWNGGVLISSGLATGRTYYFRVEARNGDNGTGPRIVAAGPLTFGRTKSGTPILYLGNVSAFQSTDNPISPNAVWTNLTDVPFVALGAFNNNVELSRNSFPQIDEFNHAVPAPPGPFPGWNGRYALPPAPVHSDVTNPDNRGPFSGIRVTGEGLWYLHIVGDSYNFIDPMIDPTEGHATEAKLGPRFNFFVDTTPADAAAMNLQAFRRIGDTVPLPAGQQVGWDEPSFRWVDPDDSPSDPTLVSPTVGYSFLFTTDDGLDPLASSDTARNTNREGFLSRSGPVEWHQIASPPITVDTTYYFKVMSLDKAGNWGNIARYVYDVVVDRNPPVPMIDFGPSILVAANGMTVAVSTSGVINVYFNEPMNPNQTDATAFDLRLIRTRENLPANVGNPNLGNPVNIGVIYQEPPLVSSPTATITPVGGLLPGCMYHLASTTRLEDESGNTVDPVLNAPFRTLMDPSVRNVVPSSAQNPVSVVTFDPGSWSGTFAGLAVSTDPARQPMASPAIKGQISKANKSLNKNANGYGKPLAVHEFNLYNPSARRLDNTFKRPVRMTMRYNDLNDNGYVDETENTPHPVRVSALALYWLDEDTGAWVRIPGSSINTVNRTVSADVRHFSVYGLLGAPAPDLASAYAYPVPYKPSIHVNGIRFNNLSSFGTIKIYTVNGDLVKTMHFDDTNANGSFAWNPVTNEAGEPLASDVYIYLIESSQQKKTGKLLVVR